MVRKRLLIVLLLLLLLAAALLAGSWWLLATPQGQRWLLAEMARRADVTIAAGEVEGRLLDHLRLVDVTVIWPGGEARLAEFELRWRPLALLRGELAIDELTLAQAQVSWLAPAPADTEREVALTWPGLEGWPLRLQASIAALRLEAITVQPPDAAPYVLDRLTAALHWRDGTVTIEGAEADLAGYRLLGTAAAGFRRPLLHLDLHLAATAATANFAATTLQANLSAETARRMAGPVILQIRGREQAMSVLLTGELAVDSDTLTLRQFALTREGRPGALNGTATAALSPEGISWHLQGTLVDLDLAADTGMATALGGSLEASGNGAGYRGHVALANDAPGWAGVQLAGLFVGTAGAIDFPELDGRWLGGELGGALHLAWEEGFSLAGTLRGRRLDPAAITPEWPGRVNFEVAGELARPAAGPLRASLRGRLLDSTLRGLALTGRIDAAMVGDDLRIAAFELRGDGFEFSGGGRLAERLDFRAAIPRLAGLVPAARGALTAEGWLRWRDGVLAGAVDGHGRQLAYEELAIDSLRLNARLPANGSSATVQLTGSGLSFRDWQLQQLGLQFAGGLPEHAIDLLARWPGGELLAAAAGGWQDYRWTGRLSRFEGRDDKAGPWRLVGAADLAATAGHLRLADLHLAGRQGEALHLDIDLDRSSWQGTAEAKWQGLDLARFNPWLALQLSGRCSGEVRLHGLAEEALELAGRIEAAGEVRQEGLRLVVRRAAGTFAWDGDGLRASADAELDGGEKLRARVDSAQPGRPALPEQGRISVAWDGLDLARLRPWLPEGIDLAGRLRGKADADWRAGWQLEMTGEATVDGGRLSWRGDEGELAADLRTARLDWAWRDTALSGEFNLALAEYGDARGSFRLPLPAQLPAAMAPDGPLQLLLTARAREHGLLPAFFPGLITASRGELEVQARAGGTWRQPDLGGRVRLTGAGAYFPTAGIELKEVALNADLAGDELRITDVTATSGRGKLTGSGSVHLQQWRPIAYRGTLSGENFSAVHLPELQLLVSPSLTVTGTGERLEVRGEIAIPELIVLGREQRGVVRESPDVIIVGAAAPPGRSLPMALDLRVQIRLGDRVLIKVAGIDARLAGGVELRITGPEEIYATGEIQVAEGIYSTYGVQLRIERGRLLYAGGPVNQPTFDILALRTIGEVKAGVLISGTPRTPLARLYAEPAMSDTDILAYIVLGHPLGTETGQLGLLSAAAGALLSHGQSVMLQNQFKRRLGIDVIAIEETGEATGSMVTVGKYLSPKLYLSFGQALFTNASEARLRYSITPKWELESRTSGETSGVDLFYRIEFD